MALRTKIILAVGLTMTGLFLALYLAARFITLSSFSDLEQREVVLNMRRVSAALSGKIHGLDVTNSDWSAWDDSYRFIKDHNQRFVRANLVKGTLENLDLNVLMFVDQQGRVVYGAGYDLDHHKYVPVPKGLLLLLRKDPSLVSHKNTNSKVSGIVRLPEGPLLISSWPILTSEDRGPVRGALIMGRFVDASVVRSLSRSTRTRLTLASPGAAGLPGNLSSAHPILERPVTDQTTVGYYLATDLRGAPAFALEAAMPRPIYSQGLATLNHFLLSLVIAGVALSVVMALILEFTVLSRVENLARDVRHIGESRDFSSRVRVTGDDELAELGADINSTLQILDTSIGEAQRADGALALSEERYRLLVEASPDAIVVEVGGSIVFANPAAARLLAATSVDDVVGRRFGEFLRRGPDVDAGPDESDGLTRAVDGGIVDTAFAKLDGTRMDAEMVAIRTTYEGRPARQVILRDVSERREIERMKAALVDMVSHELRTPLAVILGNAETVSRLHERGRHKEDCARALDRIQERAKHMAGLIESLLDMSRIQSGRFPIQLENVDLPSLIKREAESVPLTDGHWLTLNILKDCPNARCDPRRVGTAVANLVGNAVKFSPAGGEILVSLSHSKGWARISVKDSGVGIASEDQMRMFERFEQADMSDARSFQGAGVGLYLVREIMIAHGGAASVTSELGRGATFTLDLPLNPPGDISPSA